MFVPLVCVEVVTLVQQTTVYKEHTPEALRAKLTQLDAQQEWDVTGLWFFFCCKDSGWSWRLGHRKELGQSLHGKFSGVWQQIAEAGRFQESQGWMRILMPFRLQVCSFGSKAGPRRCKIELSSAVIPCSCIVDHVCLHMQFDACLWDDHICIYLHAVVSQSSLLWFPFPTWLCWCSCGFEKDVNCRVFAQGAGRVQRLPIC